jgi:hypothetical protein
MSELEPVDSRQVFVVHGRNLRARDAMFAFLRALGLSPVEWEQGVRWTGVAAPYVGDVLSAAFARVRAVVVLLTGDDEARLREHFRGGRDSDALTPQPRPNVLFEAGMALGLHPDRTILVELGQVNLPSDIRGRHTVRITDAAQARVTLRERLEQCGCAVATGGTDWLRAGRFASAARARRSTARTASTAEAEANPPGSEADQPASSHVFGVAISFQIGEWVAPPRTSEAVTLAVGNYGDAAVQDVRLEFVDPLKDAEGRNVAAMPPISRGIRVLRPGQEERFYVDDAEDLRMGWAMRTIRGAYRVDVTAKHAATGEVRTARQVVDLGDVFPFERAGPYVDAQGRPVPISPDQQVDPHPDNVAAFDALRLSEGAGSRNAGDSGR